MRRVLFAVPLLVLIVVGAVSLGGMTLGACGDNGHKAAQDGGVDAVPDARLEGFDKPDLVCPGDPGCMTVGDGVLKVGVGKRDWTPAITETYTDENLDREWSSDEPYDDANGNHKFDAVWVFGGGRAAEGVLQPVEARAIAFVQGDLKIVVLSVDAIGLLSMDMDKIRNHPNLAGVDVDQIIITSTHAHNAPDTIGLWGPTATSTGRVPRVFDSLYENASLAVKDALANPVPVTMKIASTKLINDPTNPMSKTDDFNLDIRDPVIFDPTLTIAQFVTADSPTTTVATLVNWADHPEIQNFASDVPTQISSHYVHYLRDGIENGVTTAQSFYTAGTNVPGLGGVAVFVQGALGGQIGSIRTTHPKAPDGSYETHRGDPQERVIGYNAAALGLKALAATGETTSVLPLSFKSAAFAARVENTFLNVAFIIGLLGPDANSMLVGWDPDQGADIGNYPWMPLRATFLQVGPMGLVTVPGELHPELWVGGYDGSWSWGFPLLDMTKPNLPNFDDAPKPPYMRDLVLAHDGVKYPICVGLAFNYIGYIVPHYNFVLSEDPYITEAEGDHYEEVYALSPDVERHAIDPILELLKYRRP
ncbi:hypothetical protein BH11MYX2_BH11MYX2_08360 [soil metagenome]